MCPQSPIVVVRILLAAILNTVTGHIIVTVAHPVGAEAILEMAIARTHIAMLSLENIDVVMPEAPAAR